MAPRHPLLPPRGEGGGAGRAGGRLLAQRPCESRRSLQGSAGGEQGGALGDTHTQRREFQSSVSLKSQVGGSGGGGEGQQVDAEPAGRPGGGGRPGAAGGAAPASHSAGPDNSVDRSSVPAWDVGATWPLGPGSLPAQQAHARFSPPSGFISVP